MYTRVQNITNVGGRINYVTNKEDVEEVIGIKNTADSNFWSLLAKENQEQFRRTVKAKKIGAKASEAREVVVGLPTNINKFDAAIVANMIATSFKITYGVECYVALHRKKTVDENGETKINVHAHIIFSERTLLNKPIEISEKRADRNYYYDASGKKCKKTEAVKITPKGTITQEACTRYFSDKKNFYNLKNYEPIKEKLANTFDLKNNFDIKKHFPQKHIGKNNPKAKYYEAYNELVRDLNLFFDELDQENKKAPQTAKESFCEQFNITLRFGVNQTDFVRSCFDEFKKMNTEKELTAEEKQKMTAELIQLQQKEREIKTDIKISSSALQDLKSPDFVKQKVAIANKNTIEQKYFIQLTIQFVNQLKQVLAEIQDKIIDIKNKLGVNKNSPEQPEKIKSSHQKEKEQEHF